MAQRENDLKINVNPISVPAGLSHAEFLQGLLPAVSAQRLPRGWEVDIEWRNPNTHSGRSRQWQSGEWADVLKASTEGFSTALRAIIREELGELPPPPPPPKKKAPAKKKVKAKKAVQKRAKKKLTPKQTFKKRSVAAKKGWATRRAKAGGGTK